MNEHEAMGKLVKEIVGVLNQWRKCGRLERTPDIPLSIYKKDCPDILEITEGESAKLLITLVLSAVRDGWLDEELGVVGRGWTDGFTIVWEKEPNFFARDMATQEYEPQSYPFIALRPLTGTGKEEKKNADSTGQRD